MKRPFNVVTIVLLSLWLGACSYERQFVRKDEIRSRARYTAVLPLLNLSTHPHAGRIVSEILTTELYALTDFQLMEGTAVASRLQSNDALDLDEVMARLAAQEAGKQLGVDTVVFGSVGEYRYKRGLNEDPVVGINIRMLDVHTGKILWAGSQSKTGGCFWFCEDSLNRLTQQVCNELVIRMLADGTK